MYSESFAKYNAGEGYLCFPASTNPWISRTDYYDTPERVTEAYNLLDKTGLLGKLELIKPVKAKKEELIGFHSKEYIDKLDNLSQGEGGVIGKLCQIGPNGLDVIREAAGGDFVALDEIMEGKINNAFCLQRPPAAHAERDEGFGFCVVNNFNLIVQRAREKYGLKRIMIIDIDNHYKKGIEDAWYDTDEVLYAEIHQTGCIKENDPADRNSDFIGVGKGKGYNVVIPMPAGAGNAAYQKAFEEIIEPVADQYKPELVVFVAGFASNVFDPLCRQQLTANGYYNLAERICNIANKYANGRLIAVLEGGKGNYMSFCILKVIEAMSGEKTEVSDPVENLLVRDHVSVEQREHINRTKECLSDYWKF